MAFLSAGMLVLAFPPFNLWPLAWLGLVPLLQILKDTSRRASFGWSYLTGLLFFLGTVYWFIHVTLPGMIMAVLYLALYFGFWGLGVSFFCASPLRVRLGIYPAMWVVLELIRDHLLSGFGWASLGHSQYQFLPVIQIADLTGVFGVSFVLVMSNVMASEFLSRQRKDFRQGAAVLGTALVFVFSYGCFHLCWHSPSGESYKVAVVQSNIPQSAKWQSYAWDDIQQKILSITRPALNENPDLVIWPETSFPGYMWEAPERYEEIRKFVAASRTPLLMGAVTMTGGEYFNSAILISGKGEEAGRYDKMHLVPFGEYLPFRGRLPFLQDIVPIADFSAGKDLRGFFIRPKDKTGKPGRFAAVICFEDTASGVMRKLTLNGAQFLVNITNDGWFQDTNAPFLHIQAAALQAVANRRAIVRSANTGVSGFIDSNGKIHDTVRQGKRQTMVEGYVVGRVLPHDGITFYTRFGNVFAYLCVLGVLAAGVVRLRDYR